MLFEVLKNMKAQITIGTGHSYVDWLRGSNYHFENHMRYYDQAEMLSQSLFKTSYKQLYTYQQNYVVLMMVKAGVN